MLKKQLSFHFAADPCHQLFTALSPTSPLFCFEQHPLVSTATPSHNTASVSTELKGRSIRTRIRNYSALSVVRTKIAVSATVKIHDVCIKVAISLGYHHNIFHERANGAPVEKFVKILKKIFTNLYYISAFTVTYETSQTPRL